MSHIVNLCTSINRVDIPVNLKVLLEIKTSYEDKCVGVTGMEKIGGKQATKGDGMRGN